MAFTTLLPFAVSYAVLVMLPGPNLAVVAHASLIGCRRAALRTTLGVALGASLLAAAVTGGADVLAPYAPAAGLAPFAYGALLIVIGCRAVRRAWVRGPSSPAPRALAGFRLALLTALTNPASALFFAAAAIGVRRDSIGAAAANAGVVFAVALLWFGLVGWALSMPRWKPLYGRFDRHADMGLGAVLLAFGVTAVALSLAGFAT